MVTDGNYTCGEHSVRVVKSLCQTPETNATFCANYTQKKKKKRKRKKKKKVRALDDFYFFLSRYLNLF